MAFYRAKVACFLDNSLRKAGDEFEYNGPANSNLELISGDEEVKAEAPKPKRAPKAKAD